MSEVKRYWENEYEYKRILEILDDYWLTSKDEVRVTVEMMFLKGNGEFQRKQITWINQNFGRRSTPHNNFELTTMAEIEESPLDRFWNDHVRFTILRYDKVLRTDVYALYEEFCKCEQIAPVSRNSFYSYVRGKGVAETTIKGYRYFNGIALRKENIKNEKTEEIYKVENIVWFNKDRIGRGQKRCDMSITKGKTGLYIVLRNNLCEDVANTGYIRIGFAEKDKNKMYFMAADKDHGWKMSPQPNTPTTHKCHIVDPKVAEGMLRFIGDYDIEISEDNLFFIDRRNVL